MLELGREQIRVLDAEALRAMRVNVTKVTYTQQRLRLISARRKLYLPGELKMKANVGGIDKLLRIVAGAALIGLTLSWRHRRCGAGSASCRWLPD